MNPQNNYLTNQFGLDGKVAVVTGAVGGIGLAIVEALCGAGAVCVLADIALDKALKQEEMLIQRGFSVTAVKLDMRDDVSRKECVKQIISKYKCIDILVNCAGINKREGILDVEESTYDAIMDVNLKGLYFFTQEVAPHMINNNGGRIVNMSSHNAQGMLGGVSVYGATKAAVSALTRSMAIEWAKYNITANAIAPGHILTELTKVTWEHPERSVYLKERIAMERPGTPQEVSGMVVMLCSAAGSYMTGQTYHIDGGCLAGGKPWPFDTSWK